MPPAEALPPLPPRPLARVPAGEAVFIDANIFVYHFTGLSPECTVFLERCEREELLGVTSVHILLETLHRLMMLEALNKGLLSPGNVAKKLREKPEVVRQLRDYQVCTEAIQEMGLEVLPLDVEIVPASRAARQRDGLLVNDSLTVALMEVQGLRALATADPDFAGVESISVYRPQDLP
jgi:predicted nucleic acid-binding protein